MCSLKDIYIVQVLHYCDIYNQHKSCQIGLLHFVANVPLASKNIVFEEKNIVCILFSAYVFVYSIQTGQTAVKDPLNIYPYNTYICVSHTKMIE